MLRVLLENMEPNEMQFIDSSLLGCCSFNKLHITILRDDSRIKANVRIKANGAEEQVMAYTGPSTAV